MKSSIYVVLIIVALNFYSHTEIAAQTVKIMPLGNSITYDSNSFDITNPRPSEDRISYRYKLSQLLDGAGYNFDFVGSEDAGNNYFQDAQLDDNAGFPGIETDELANLISTGYNAYSHQYVSAGPYLNFFPADIILLHIGTNNLITSAYQVDDLLDKIRFYDSDVIILVARIVNRQVYHSSTTTFNNNVEVMINGRGDSRIKMVNIETGAGINYSLDMADNLHPNPNGYNKMADKWFDAIQKLNQAPVISNIPTQYTDKGESFPDLNLDNYVTDLEDPDFLMVWTYEQLPDSKLSISIDASRIMHISPDPSWSGGETIKLKASDSGNGAFVRSDSVYVTFNVDHVNSPPQIVSTPDSEVLQNSTYIYTMLANDPDGDNLSYSAIDMPSWLTFNSSSHILSGTPEQAQVGLHYVILRVTDGEVNVDHPFQIEVIDTNDPPEVTSQGEVEAFEDQYFTFSITATDADGDQLTYELIDTPSWINYSVSQHALSGKPNDLDIGIYNLTVHVSDGSADVYEALKIIVNNVNDLPVITSTPITVGQIGESYIYRFTANDVDPDDVLTFSVLNKPDWITFLESSTDALLYGTPGAGDVGSNLVILEVSDGQAEVLQAFTINVSFPNSSPETENLIEKVYPNPASEKVHFTFAAEGEITLYIVNMAGAVQSVHDFESTRNIEIDISMLPDGIYMYKAYQGDKETIGKIIKN